MSAPTRRNILLMQQGRPHSQIGRHNLPCIHLRRDGFHLVHPEGKQAILLHLRCLLKWSGVCGPAPFMAQSQSLYARPFRADCECEGLTYF